MEYQFKETMKNLYEKFNMANITREFLTKEMCLTELGKIEKDLRSGKPIRLEKCICNNSKSLNPDDINSLEPNLVSCYTCLKLFLEEQRNKEEKIGNKDFLGWGLDRLFEQESSDESTSNTSTDDEMQGVKRRLSTTRHKILRKLRRKKPELFELNYLDMKSDEMLKAEVEDPQLLAHIKKIRIIRGNTKPEKKYVPSKQHTSQTPKDYSTLYGGGQFDFSQELHLKKIYSDTKFDFLTGIVHYYQKFLKTGPEERYRSVSELIMKSEQTICKDEDDIVVQYYGVLNMKESEKRNCILLSKLSTPKDKTLNLSVVSKEKATKEKVSKLHEVVNSKNLNTLKRTGVLDLSHKSIEELPQELLFIEPIEKKNSKKPNQSSPKVTNAQQCICNLNLSNNKLRTFSVKSNRLETLVHLYLANNKIDNLPEAFGTLKRLEVLDLECNLLTLLPDSFSCLPSLKELHLKKNSLISLPNNFGNLKKLKYIDLRWNKLVKLPDTSEDLDSLEYLKVSFNKLKSLPTDMSNLRNLVVLDASYNRLPKLPLMTSMTKLMLVNAMGNLIKQFPDFSNSKSLCEIRLDGNRLKFIQTKHMRDCPVIQLTLSHNKIVSIPDDLYKIETLVMLDCTNNRLSALPWSLARLKYLTCIRVEENHIENIANEIIQAGSKSILNVLVQKLFMYEGDNEAILSAKNDFEILYINENTITTPVGSASAQMDLKEIAETRILVKKRLDLSDFRPEWITIALKCKVKTIDISKNKFRYIPPCLKMLNKTLQELYVRENILKTLPDFVGRMQQLVVLDVSFNCLDNLPLTMTTCRLKKLVCRHNQFTFIPKVVFMIQSLETLDFSENSLKEIDVDGLRNLRKLYCLNLRNNLIRELPTSLGFFVNLRWLDVTENLIKRPGPNIIKGGTQAILDYLKRHPNNRRYG